MGLFSRNKGNEAVNQSVVMTVAEGSQGASHGARPKKGFVGKKERRDPEFSDMHQAGDFSENGKAEFAEIYGSALVSRRQHFVVSLGALALCGIAMIYALTIASNKIAVPWFVEIDKATGVLSKPVKIESLTPNEAVIRSTLAIFAEKCFTIDPKLSRIYLSDCARLATGRAVEQLRAFRAENDVIAKIAKGSEIRFAKAKSVDITTKGTAFVHLETRDVGPDGTELNPKNYRLRLDYVFIPPKDEDELIQNPLGLYVSMFTSNQER